MTYNLHRTQQRTTMEERGEGRKRERKRDEGREGVSEGLKIEKRGNQAEGRVRDEILYNERKREREIKSKRGRVRRRVRKNR